MTAVPYNGRCPWPKDDPQMIAYHDTEWGVPQYDGKALWGKLVLDGFQAGLSWQVVLRKREALYEAFDDFDPEMVASFDENKIEKLLQNPGIIRSRAKIKAAIGNAQAFLDMHEKGQDFSQFLWSFVDGAPKINHLATQGDMPSQSPESEALSKALKKQGFKFCGPVIVYAFMQAVGMVNDHLVACPRWQAVQR